MLRARFHLRSSTGDPGAEVSSSHPPERNRPVRPVALGANSFGKIQADWEIGPQVAIKKTITMHPEQTFASLHRSPSAARPDPRPGRDAALENIYSVFGETAVLLPVPANLAGKMSVPCAGVTWEQTREAAHQDRLTRENIAVACRQGLFAVFFATEAAREGFLQSNSPLRTSLLIRGPLGWILWLRCADGLPVNLVLRGSLCWLGAGEAILVQGRGDLATAYTVVNDAKPAVVRFDSIVWPEALRVEFILHKVYLKHGNPTITDPRNRTIPSWDFWARCFSLIHHVRYDLARESFVQQPLAAEIQLRSTEQVFRLIAEFLSEFGRQPRFALLLKYLDQKYLKEFLTSLKIVTAQSRDPDDHLEKFLAATLEAWPGADVSSEELNEAHLRYFQSNNLSPYPLPLFQKRVPIYVQRMFHVVRSNKIKRNQTSCRGYVHVRIKPQAGN